MLKPNYKQILNQGVFFKKKVSSATLKVICNHCVKTCHGRLKLIFRLVFEAKRLLVSTIKERKSFRKFEQTFQGRTLNFCSTYRKTFEEKNRLFLSTYVNGEKWRILSIERGGNDKNQCQKSRWSNHHFFGPFTRFRARNFLPLQKSLCKQSHKRKNLVEVH